MSVITTADLRANLENIRKDAELYPTIAKHMAGMQIKEWALEDNLQNALYKLPKDILEMYNALPVAKR